MVLDNPVLAGAPAKRQRKATARKEEDTHDLSGRLAVLERLVPQARRHVTHPIERVAAPEQVLHVLGHDPRHVLQVLVQPVQPVPGRSRLVAVGQPGRLGPSRVEVQSLGPLDKSVKLDERVRSQAGFERRFGRVRPRELGAEFRQVREGEFARVRLVGNDEVDDRVRDQVAVRAVPLVSVLSSQQDRPFLERVPGTERGATTQSPVPFGEYSSKKGTTHWRVHCPLSIEQRGSDWGVNLRKMSFACCLYSGSLATSCVGDSTGGKRYGVVSGLGSLARGFRARVWEKLSLKAPVGRCDIALARAHEAVVVQSRGASREAGFSRNGSDVEPLLP